MGVGMISSKTVVIILSVLFLAGALGMWIMAGWTIHSLKDLDKFFSSSYTIIPAGVMIGIGIIFLLGAIAGFVATCRDSRICSLLFFIFIFLLCVLLITAVALAFAYKRHITEKVRAGADNAMHSYGNDTEATNQVDFVQKTFTCCGTYNYTFWNTTPWAEWNPDQVPTSCCINRTEPGCNVLKNWSTEEVKTHIWTEGCVSRLEEGFRHNLLYLGIGAVVVLLLLILGMIGACYVLWQRKDESYFNLEIKRDYSSM